MSLVFRSFAVLPAAGVSRRMGRHKLLLPWRGATVMETVLAAWQASSVERIVVVVRPGDEELARLVRGERIELVVADHSPADMKASVLLGLAHIERQFQPAANDAWLLAPADLPRLPVAVIEEVLAAYQSRRMDNLVRPDERLILVPTISGKRGHPVLFPWSHVAAARRLATDQGLNALLQPGAWQAVPGDHLANADVWNDLDLPEDYTGFSSTEY